MPLPPATPPQSPTIYGMPNRYTNKQVPVNFNPSHADLASKHSNIKSDVQDEFNWLNYFQFAAQTGSPLGIPLDSHAQYFDVDPNIDLAIVHQANRVDPVTGFNAPHPRVLRGSTKATSKVTAFLDTGVGQANGGWGVQALTSVPTGYLYQGRKDERKNIARAKLGGLFKKKTVNSIF